MSKKVIWITGSMSAGKSTQRRLLCGELGTQGPTEVYGDENGKHFHYTGFGKSIACLGKVKQLTNEGASMCDGLDAVFGKVKKEGGIHTVDVALNSHKVVVIEGSQTSPSWAKELQPILERQNAKLYLVHLYLSYEQAFKRLRFRQLSKDETFKGVASDYELTDKNIESIIGKRRQFNNCYDKVKGLCKRLRIDARQSQEDIFNEIISFVFG